MTSYPLVSVGLPTHNGERCIALMLQSLVSQTYSNIELIISNNNSADKTLEISNRYKRYFTNVRIYTQKDTLSAADNFNFVLNKASGKYFIWASDDDAFHPKAIESLYKLISSDNSVVGACPLFLNIEGESNSITHRYNTIDKYAGLKMNLDDYLKLKVTDHKANLIYSLFKRKDLLAISGIENLLTLSAADVFVVQKLLLRGSLYFSKSHLFFKRIQLMYDRDTMNLFETILQALKNLFLNSALNFDYIVLCLIQYRKQFTSSLPHKLEILEKIRFDFILIRQLFEQFLLIALSSPKKITDIKNRDFQHSQSSLP